MITAKDVYIFASICQDIQKKNINMIREALKNPKIEKPKRKRMKQEMKLSEEKLIFLENTKSIVLALYDKQGKAIKITKEDEATFKEKFKLEEK